MCGWIWPPKISKAYFINKVVFWIIVLHVDHFCQYFLTLHPFCQVLGKPLKCTRERERSGCVHLANQNLKTSDLLGFDGVCFNMYSVPLVLQNTTHCIFSNRIHTAYHICRPSKSKLEGLSQLSSNSIIQTTKYTLLRTMSILGVPVCEP